MKLLNIGVLGFHGDVEEHIQATQKAAQNLKLQVNVIAVRTKDSLDNLDGLIIPGGESTTLYKLCIREVMFEQMKQIKNIFGTCAGAIMLAKNIRHQAENQESLGLMDLEIDRNAYGRQAQSFVEEIKTKLGKINAVFIRAPKIISIGKAVNVLAKNRQEIIACEERIGAKFYLAACFHPELTTLKFHEYFLKNIR